MLVAAEACCWSWAMMLIEKGCPGLDAEDEKLAYEAAQGSVRW